ncbi:uncharacterized protein BDW43DRAFT_259892, partial [Aspergillus alliaceus]|uniref:uncharacterized protein n=1 Tax=Petromyces alliaceus TaxID=209559 RepID=UPI0012A457AC
MLLCKGCTLFGVVGWRDSSDHVLLVGLFALWPYCCSATHRLYNYIFVRFVFVGRKALCQILVYRRFTSSDWTRVLDPSISTGHSRLRGTCRTPPWNM